MQITHRALIALLSLVVALPALAGADLPMADGSIWTIYAFGNATALAYDQERNEVHILNRETSARLTASDAGATKPQTASTGVRLK